jgi:hypothetical protein
MGRRRLLPTREFPAYAYLPGRHPHPVRDPAGHSFQVPPVHVVATVGSEEYYWGADLFNHGYYWEAHEAWEGLWKVAGKGSEIRCLLKGLILLSAAGVKIREGKRTAAGRHAGRAAGLFDPWRRFSKTILNERSGFGWKCLLTTRRQPRPLHRYCWESVGARLSRSLSSSSDASLPPRNHSARAEFLKASDRQLAGRFRACRGLRRQSCLPLAP